MRTASRIDDVGRGSGGSQHRLLSSQLVVLHDAQLDSLEELSRLAAKLRARLGSAHPEEQPSLLATIKRLESRYRLRRAELA